MEKEGFRSDRPEVPRARNHVDRIQEGLCSWGITARGVGSNHALHWVLVRQMYASTRGISETLAGMRGISETLGFFHMVRKFKTKDWGRIVHCVDASACRAITLRRGCGGVKHITFKSLWGQEAVRDCSTEMQRISRDEMHAHIFACPSSAEEELRKHLTELLSFCFSIQRRPNGAVWTVLLDLNGYSSCDGNVSVV